MLKWVQSGLSVVAGTAEPEYGREAIHPVTDFIKKGDPVSRETTVEDFAWRKPNYTNVETQTFYFTDLKTGYTGFAQQQQKDSIGPTST
ncbi:putative cell survival pathways protein [Candidozyma auris]